MTRLLSVAAIALLAAVAAGQTFSYKDVGNVAFNGPSDSVPTCAPAVAAFPPTTTLGGQPYVIHGSAVVTAVAFNYNITKYAFCVSSFPSQCNVIPGTQTSSTPFNQLTVWGTYIVATSAQVAIFYDLRVGLVTKVVGRSDGVGHNSMAPVVCSTFNQIIIPLYAGTAQKFAVYTINGTGAIFHSADITASFAMSTSAPVVNSKHLYAVLDTQFIQWSLSDFKKTQSVTASCALGDSLTANIGLQFVAASIPVAVYYGTLNTGGFIVGGVIDFHNATTSAGWCYKSMNPWVVQSVSGYDGGAVMVNFRRTDALTSQVTFFNASTGGKLLELQRGWTDRLNVPVSLYGTNNALLNTGALALSAISLANNKVTMVANISNMECQNTPLQIAGVIICQAPAAFTVLDYSLKVVIPTVSLNPMPFAFSSLFFNDNTAAFAFVDTACVVHIPVVTAVTPAPVDHVHPGIIVLVVVMIVAFLAVGGYLFMRHKRRAALGDYAAVS